MPRGCSQLRETYLSLKYLNRIDEIKVKLPYTIFSILKKMYFGFGDYILLYSNIYMNHNHYIFR